METIKIKIVGKEPHYKTQFTIGVQTFIVCERPTLEEAEFYERMLIEAFKSLTLPLPNDLPDDDQIEDQAEIEFDKFDEELSYHRVKSGLESMAKWMRSLSEKDISRLKEAAKNLLSLHAAEMEGIILPTKEQWFKAVTELEKEAYKESCKKIHKGK